MVIARRVLLAAATGSSAALRCRHRAGALHHGRVDDVDRAVGPVRLPAADLRSDRPGVKVRVVALGTGQALDLARRGDADVVFVHANAGRGEIPGRRAGREALSGDVQRLRPDRTEERSGEGRAAARTSSPR